MPLPKVISEFKKAGLGSIPGGGGEILVEPSTAEKFPLKDKQRPVARGDAGRARARIEIERHDDVRPCETMKSESNICGEFVITDRSGGFTRSFAGVPNHRPYGAEGEAPTGVSEYLRTTSRWLGFFLDNIENVQSSWVTQGPGIGQIALRYGANDFGSVMMEENVVSSAGTTFVNAAEIESLIQDAATTPRRRIIGTNF